MRRQVVQPGVRAGTVALTMRFWSTARSRFAIWRCKFETMADSPWENEWPEITDSRVRAAFARVDRAEFVPEDLRQWSEKDAPLPIGQGQTISQPFVVALMTQALALQPGDKVLEVGTGSGYQTAILCELTAEDGEASGRTIYSIERHAELSQRAGDTLQALGYHVHLRVGDGVEGWPSAGPFAAVILTAAPTYLARPLWDQLAEGGRLVAPIGRAGEDQRLWLLHKVHGKMRVEPMGAVRFVPMISPLLDEPSMRISIGDTQM